MEKKKGKSKPFPFRLDAENDLAVQRFKEMFGIENRNLTINLMLKNYDRYVQERMKALEEVKRLMAYWGIKPKELE